MSSHLELYDIRGLQWESFDDDDETVSDAGGAGRTAGKLVSWGGRHLDAFIVWLSRQLGVGPSGPMTKMIRLMHKSRGRCSEIWCGGGDKMTVPHAAAPKDILQTLLKSDTICNVCLEKHQALLSNKRMVVYTKSLMNMLR
jgi:hypothetical protein